MARPSEGGRWSVGRHADRGLPGTAPAGGKDGQTGRMRQLADAVLAHPCKRSKLRARGPAWFCHKEQGQALPAEAP